MLRNRKRKVRVKEKDHKKRNNIQIIPIDLFR